MLSTGYYDISALSKIAVVKTLVINRKRKRREKQTGEKLEGLAYTRVSRDETDNSPFYGERGPLTRPLIQ